METKILDAKSVSKVETLLERGIKELASSLYHDSGIELFDERGNRLIPKFIVLVSLEVE